MIKHDIQNNNQLCLIDPHTGLYAELFSWCGSKGHKVLSKVLSFDCLNQSRWTSYDDFMNIMGYSCTLVNLAADNQLSQDNAQVLGGFIVNHIHTAVQNRTDDSPYYLYIDSCEFLAKPLIPILEQGRKFNLYLILTLQSLDQLRKAGEDVYQAVIANTKTKVTI